MLLPFLNKSFFLVLIFLSFLIHLSIDHCLSSHFFTSVFSICSRYSLFLSPVLVAPQLNSSSPGSDIIVVTWDPVDQAVLYTLCLIMEGSVTRVTLNTTETNMTFGALEPGTTYSIKANAWDPDGIQGDDITISQITRTDKSL